MYVLFIFFFCLSGNFYYILTSSVVEILLRTGQLSACETVKCLYLPHLNISSNIKINFFY